MAKLYSNGALISYGPTLPATATTPDGMLFYKTDDADAIAKGLYVFGFIQDHNSSSYGNQVTQGWRITSAGGVDADTLDGLNSTAFQLVDSDLSALAGISGTGLYVVTGTGTSSVRSIAAGSSKISVSNGSGVAGNPTIDVVEANLTLTNLGGTLSVAKGGTGNTSTVQGGVVYGASASQLSTTPVGATGYVLKSNGSAPPTWVDPATLVGTVSYATTAGTAGSATYANQLSTARTIALGTGATGTATSFDGSTNITIPVTALNADYLTAGTVPANRVLWNRISDLYNGVASFTNPSPITTAIVTARPSLFYTPDHGSAMPLPTQMPASSITGVDAYNTTDAGMYQIGMTVIGTTYRGFQLLANWNYEEGIPQGLRWRVNDDTTTPSAWGAWATILDTSNAESLFVSKTLSTSQTILSPLVVGNAAGDTLTVNGITLHWNNSLIQTTGAVSASGNIISQATTSGNIVKTNNTAGLTGYVQLVSSSGGSPGLIELRDANNFRIGFITSESTVSVNDTGEIKYNAGTHTFTGGVNVIGALTATGNITAYASDARLKTNIKPIKDAVAKVGKLGGYSYDWDAAACAAAGFIPENPHEHGLIAQQVQEVMADAVATAPFNKEYLTVRYDRVIALLTAAINEQQEQINELKAEINRLKV